VAVGRLVPRKGVEQAVRALRHLPDAELVVAGGPDAHDLPSDPEAVRLQHLAAELGVADRLRMVGRVAPADLPGVLGACDVLLATPWYEPFGIAVLEAMAAGLPVVASAVGGMLDTVRDGVTGRLVPVDATGHLDPVALAEAVRDVVDDPATAARAGAAGREVARQRYDWARVAAATESAYEGVLRDVAGRDAGTDEPAARRPARRRGRQTTRAWLHEHLGELEGVLSALEAQGDRLDRWGRQLVDVVDAGGRLLVAGHGGSAAEAQHLTTELVGRFTGARRPLSAIALRPEAPSLAAVHDDRAGEVYVRQVEAHGREGDLLLLLSASSRDLDVLRAAQRARELGMRVWALTDDAPNPLRDVADEVVALPGPSTSAVQEGHLVAVHVLCVAVEVHLRETPSALDLTALPRRAGVPA